MPLKGPIENWKAIKQKGSKGPMFMWRGPHFTFKGQQKGSHKVFCMSLGIFCITRNNVCRSVDLFSRSYEAPMCVCLKSWEEKRESTALNPQALTVRLLGTIGARYKFSHNNYIVVLRNATEQTVRKFHSCFIQISELNRHYCGWLNLKNGNLSNDPCFWSHLNFDAALIIKRRSNIWL